MNRSACIGVVLVLTSVVAAMVERVESGETKLVDVDIAADVSDDEWNAAIGLKDSGILMPKQLNKVKEPPPPANVSDGARIVVIVAAVIRADGSQGVYKVQVNEAQYAPYAKRIAEWLRRQKYEPPMLDDKAVAIKGDFRKVVDVEKSVHVPGH